VARNQFENAHDFFRRVEDEAHGAGDGAVFAGDEITGSPGLDQKQAVVKPERPKDLSVANAAALDAQQRRITLGGQFFQAVGAASGVGRRFFIDDDIWFDAAVFQCQRRQGIGFGHDTGVIFAQIQSIAEVAREQRDAFAIFELPLQGKEPDWIELMAFGNF
jgi:hypothetical protein